MLFPFLPFMVQFLVPNVKDTAVGKMMVHVGGCAIKLLINTQQPKIIICILNILYSLPSHRDLKIFLLCQPYCV